MQRYAGLSIFLHWLMAVLILFAFVLGFYMVDLGISPTKFRFYSWHKWLGVSLFALIIIRLIARRLMGAPAYPSSMKVWEKRLAQSTHVALYFLLFTVPVSGYLYTYAAGFPVVYLGLIELPALIAPDPSLKQSFKALHEWLTSILLLLIGLHIAAALKHHFIDKDGLLRRMLPHR